MSCHGYKAVMSVLCTPLQVKCYPIQHKKQKKGGRLSFF